MNFNELTPEEQSIFIEIANSKFEDEVFIGDGRDYYTLITKGLIKEIPNPDLSASLILTKEGKKMRDQILKDHKA